MKNPFLCKSDPKKHPEQKELLSQDFTLTFYKKFDLHHDSNPISKEKPSFSFEEVEETYFTTNTINPKFYNVNLIELARKQERKSFQLTDYNCNHQINLLEDCQYKETSSTKKIPISFKTNKTSQKEAIEERNLFTETKHSEKKVDSEGNKMINQYKIIKQLGRWPFRFYLKNKKNLYKIYKKGKFWKSEIGIK